MSDLINFEGHTIRQTTYNDEIYFSVVDVVAVLSESPNPRRYWSDLKKQDNQLYAISVQLKLPAVDGKRYKTDCANREGIFRIIQSIPSPNAEPFKLWLARTGEERLQEIEDPSKAMDRVRQGFRDLGYSDEWIETRIRTKIGRIELTNEWKERGIQKHPDYAILTAILSLGTFGLIPSEHKRVKGLGRENLRDHMTRQELIFIELAEIATKEEAINADAKGFEENKEAAAKGGDAAGVARKAFEERIGQKVVSSNNFKEQIKEAKKRMRLEKKKDKLK